MEKRKPASTTLLFGSPREDESSERAPAPWPSSGPPPYVEEEILRYIREGLSRFGTNASLKLEGRQLFLSSGAVRVSCALGPWALTWATLSEPARRTHAANMARTLASGRPRSTDKRTENNWLLDTRLSIAVVFLALLSAYISFAGGRSPPAVPSSTGESEKPHASTSPNTQAREPAQERSSRVCAATEARIYRGASVGLADVDGWLVEIALMVKAESRELRTSPQLSAFVENPARREGSRFIWKDEPELGALNTSDTVVRVSTTAINQESQEPLTLLVLSFGGTLVDSYFLEESRRKYFHIADALSRAFDAEIAAVYARCFDNTSHALGSWFRGGDAGEAAAALVYFMGLYANPPHFSEANRQSAGDIADNLGLALKNASTKSSSIDRKELATVLGQEGGMAMGKSGEFVTISFPFRDGNRASRASRTLARNVGLSD